MARTKFRVSILLLAVFVGCGPDEGETPPHPRPDVMSVEQGLTVCPGPNVTQGIDIYHGDGVIDWGKVSGAGIKFAYAKATEDLTFVDSEFANNWSGMKANGIIRGGYHFFHPDIDGTQQADHYIATVGTIDDTDLPPMLDWETTTATGSTAATHAQEFIDEIKLKTGRQTLIYTSHGIWASIAISGTAFGVNPLWVANWGVSCPSMPTAWTTWEIWQYSASGTVNGVPATAVDLDEFDGTIDELNAWIATTVYSTPMDGGMTGGGAGGGGGSGGGGGAPDAGTGGGSGTGGGIAAGGGSAAGGGVATGGGVGTGGGSAGTGGGSAGTGGGSAGTGGGSAGTGGGSAGTGGGSATGGGAGGGGSTKGGCGCNATDGFTLWSLALGLLAWRRKQSLSHGRRWPKAG